MKKRLFYLLVLLLTMMSQGARANWTGGTYTASANETLDAITVSGDAMLIINDGVTVTVNGGIKVTSGTLTIVGHGTLVVNGAKGKDGLSINDHEGNPGGAAISGNIIVRGATVNANGGAGGKGVITYSIGYAGNGGIGGAAFSGAVTIYSGTITAKAGNGGKGGDNVEVGFGGTGGNGGIAFTGTLTYYGGTVNANGGVGGNEGTGKDGNGGNGDAGKAFANSVNFQNTPTTLTDGSSTINQSQVTNHTTVNISGSGVVQELPPTDASGVYLISSTYDWITFADAVNTGTTTFGGKTVKLTANISDVTTMVATGDYPFAGTFDGDCHTLTVNITSSGAAALFSKVGNATIKNLHVTGSVKTTMTDGADHTGGLISRAGGSVTIENVRFSATVTGLTYYSGFIGNGNRDDVSIVTTIKMTGCVFDGQLTENVAGETQHAGGFIGWGGNMTITMTDCLFAGTCTIGSGGSGAKNFHPVGYTGNSGISATLNNVYYSVAPSAQTPVNNGTPISNNAKQMRTISKGDGVSTLAISGKATEYNVSNITSYAYNKGLKYTNILYAGNGESVSLTLSHADAEAGQHFKDYAVSGGGSLNNMTSDTPTLTMGDADQTISAEYADNPSHKVSFAITEPGWSTTPSGTAREGETVTVSYQGEHKVKIVGVKDIGAPISTASQVTMTGTKTGDTYNYSGTFTMSTVDMYVSNVLYYKLSAEEHLADNQTTYQNQSNFYLDRTLTKDVWNTFASPFAIPANKIEAYFGAGAKVRKLSSTTIKEGNVLSLNFENATKIDVGYPYIVKPTVNVVDPTFADVNDYINSYIHPTRTTYVDFEPTLGKKPITLIPEDVLMMTTEGKLVHPSNLGDIKGYRGYFVLHDAASQARAFVINFGDGETTDIDATLVNSEKVNSDVYDLQGRKVTQPKQKGIYIQNGRKAIIK